MLARGRSYPASERLPSNSYNVLSSSEGALGAEGFEAPALGLGGGVGFVLTPAIGSPPLPVLAVEAVRGGQGVNAVAVERVKAVAVAPPFAVAPFAPEAVVVVAAGKSPDSLLVCPNGG